MRLPDWDVRLTEWAQTALGRRFCWGRLDCALLAFEAFDALTGGALADAYRDQYGTAGAARRFMRRWAIDAAQVLRASGCVAVKPPFAQRGDILLADHAGWLCAHVCMGERVLMVPRGGRVAWGATTEALSLPGVFALRVA